MYSLTPFTEQKLKLLDNRNLNYLTFGIMLQNHENENFCKIGKKCKNHFERGSIKLTACISIVKQLLDENDIMHLL